VLNKKHIVVKKLPHMEVEKTIRNSGTGTIDEPMPVESKYDFSHLNQIIREDNDGVIALEYDIVLKDYELDFFEGGIEIDKSNITIEGNDHVIDACGKTRIFNVVGKDITIRNVIFKNGFVSNKYGEHVTGGGAIKTVKDSSLTLENCQFIDNSSDNDGGAIQNNGTLHSKNNQYLNNNSKYNGGSICNNNLLYTTNDTFNDNNARIAGAIYNNERLNVRDISLSNNDSDFKQPIYNADTITIKNTPSNGGNILLSYIGAGINTEEMIYNTCEVNEMETDGWESFNLLKDKLEKSREISLEKNVKIEYGDIGTDEISIHNDIVFNGNGHVIDFNHLNLNFKIRNDVVFKNVVFKNAYVHKDALFEIESKTKFVNVQFINNRAAADNCLIKNNNGEVVFTDSSFCNNSTKNNSLISNNGELAIVNTDFINNDGQSSGTVINNIKDNNDKVSIENSGFINNFSAREGATIYSQSFTVFEIRDSKFINNCSNVYGGAIYNFGEFKLSNCIFKGNSSSQGGALYSMHGSVFDIDGCVFKENDAREGGGAIVNFGKISIKGTDFIKNTTLKEGGAINNQSTGMVIRNCNFNENEAQEFGGAIATADVDVRKLIDCTFKGNNPSDVN
jgi:predicted outer membrane repeat protein